MQDEIEVDSNARPRVLVVDDEASVRHVLNNFLEMMDCLVHCSASTEEALKYLEDSPAPDAALVDIVLPGKSGLELVTEIGLRCPDTEVVLITSYGSVETAVDAMRRGAYDYLQKPFRSLDHVWETVQRAVEKKRLTVEMRNLLEEQSHTNRAIVQTAEQMSAEDRYDDGEGRLGPSSSVNRDRQE